MSARTATSVGTDAAHPLGSHQRCMFKSLGSDRPHGECSHDTDRILTDMERAALIVIYADEIMPDDILVHAEEQHRITYVDRHAGWAWPIAGDGTGWAIALAHQPITVRRPAACLDGPPSPVQVIRWRGRRRNTLAVDDF